MFPVFANVPGYPLVFVLFWGAAFIFLLAMARHDGMRDMARTWVQGMVYPPRLGDHELVDGILDMFERKTPDYFELQIRALLARP